jgi:hypothetical protein
MRWLWRSGGPSGMFASQSVWDRPRSKDLTHFWVIFCIYLRSRSILKSWSFPQFAIECTAKCHGSLLTFIESPPIIQIPSHLSINILISQRFSKRRASSQTDSFHTEGVMTETRLIDNKSTMKYLRISNFTLQLEPKHCELVHHYHGGD